MLTNKFWWGIVLQISIVMVGLIGLGGCASNYKRAFETSATIVYHPRNGKSMTQQETKCINQINEDRIAQKKKPVQVDLTRPIPKSKAEKAQTRMKRGLLSLSPVTWVMAGASMPHQVQQGHDVEDFKVRIEQCLIDGLAKN